MDEEVALANKLADTAGEIARRYFRTRLAVDDKPDKSPVTVADREAEQAMRAAIRETFPAHGVVGEEFGAENADAEFCWILDPIDGTKAFITGKPSFGTLIALLHNGRPVLGVIDQPILRERWLGVTDRPSTLNGEPIKTRACPTLAPASLYATTPDMFVAKDADSFALLRGQVKLVRYGADCYAYGLLAAGFVDLVVEASLQPYDYLALVPVIEGAGGVITDWQGQALSRQSDGRVVAAGDPRAHAAVLESFAHL